MLGLTVERVWLTVCLDTCTLLDEDRLDFLKRSNKEEFMAFLK